MAGGRKLGELFFEIRARTEGLSRDLQDSERQLSKLSAFVAKNPVVAIGGVATALAGVAVQATRVAVAFEASMAKVNTVAKVSTAELNALGDGVKAIFARSSIRDIDELTNGLYQILSSGIDASRGLEVLDVATKAAIGGFTDVATVADGLTTVLNAYKGTNLTAAAAADILAKAVNNGKIEFAEIASQIGGVVTTAASFGTSFEEVAAVLTQLSLTGVGASEGVTGLNAAMTNIIRPAEQFKAQFGELAARFDESRLARDGFIQFLLDFRRESGGSSEALKQLFSSTQGYRTVVALLNDEGAGLTTQLGEMRTATGAVGEAFGTVEETAKAASQRLKNELSKALLDLGERFLPLVNASLEQTIRLFKLLGAGSLSTKELDNAFAELLSFGSESGGVFTASASSAQAAGRALRQLVEESESGLLSLERFDREGLAALETRVRFFRDARFFDPDQLRQIDALVRKIQSARTALDAPAPKAGTGRTGPTGKSPEDLAKEAAAATAAARTTRELEDAFADLFAKAGEGSISVVDFEQRLRDLQQRFDDTKGKTAAMTARFGELSAQAGRVGAALGALKAEQAAQEFEKLRNALLPEALRTFTDATAELRKALTAKGITGDAQEEIVALTRVSEEGARELAALDQRLATIGESGLKPMQRSNLLLEEQKKLEADLIALSGQRGTAVEAKRAVIAEGLLKIQREFVKLADENVFQIEDASTATDGLANALANAGQAAYGIATAVLGANSQITRAIGGAAQLAQSFANIATLAQEAGGFAKLFSTGSGIASALPAIGGIIAGVGAVISAFNRPNPEQERHNAILKENNKRLADLRDGLTEALGLSAGTRAGLIVRDVAVTRDQPGPIDDVTGEPTTVTVKRDVRDVIAELNAMGISLADVRKLAKDLGIEFAGLVPTIDELIQVQVAAAINFQRIIQRYRDTVEGQLDANDARDRLIPDRSPLDSLLDDLEVLGGPKGAGVFAEIRDLILAGDFEGARQKIRQFFEDFVAGNIDLAALGDLDPSKIIDYIVQIATGIDAAAPRVRTAAEQFSDAMEAWNLAVEQGSMTAEERLTKAKDLFTELFPDLAADIDFSSAEAFAKSRQKFIDAISADGEITDAEREALAMLDAVAAAFGYVGTAADQAAQDLAAFAAKVQAAFDDIDFQIELFDIQDPVAQAQVYVDRLGALFPEIASIFGQFSIATEQGRAQIEAALIAWIQTLTDPAAIEAGLAILNKVRAIPDPTPDETDTGRGREQSTRDSAGIASITERTGAAMAEFLRIANRQRDELLKKVDLLTGGRALGVGGAFATTLSPTALLQPPALPAPAPSAPTVRITFQQTFTGDIYADDADGTLAKVGAVSEAGMNRALGAKLLDWRNYRGGYP